MNIPYYFCFFLHEMFRILFKLYLSLEISPFRYNYKMLSVVTSVILGFIPQDCLHELLRSIHKSILNINDGCL